MSFLYPQFLFALFAVLIPVIIHLFNFQRHKKVYFSNVAFLKEVKHSTKAKSNLKHLLILLSRILAIIAIVLAFAQPFLPVKNQSKDSTNIGSSIFIDNSFSTENHNTDGKIFDIAREIGFQLTDELPSHIDHQLLTNQFSGAEQHLYPTTEITKTIEKTTVIGKTHLFSEIIKRQTSAFDEKPFNSYIISDFQKSQFDFDHISTDTTIQYTLIPILPVQTANLSIDSVWFVNPVHRINQPEQIHFRIHNYSDQVANQIRTTLLINESQKSFGNFQIQPHSYIDTFLIFNSKSVGWKNGELKIDDSPIVFDNSLYFNFNILNEIKVLTINSANATSYVKKAFATEPYFDFTEMDELAVDFGALAQTNILILNEVSQFSSGMISSIQKFVTNGGSLFIIPSANKDQTELNGLLTQLHINTLGKLESDSTRINYLNQEDNLYQGVFTSKDAKLNLPQIYSHFKTSKSQSGEHVLLRTVTQQSILSNWSIHKGHVFLFTIPLQSEFSNMRRHSIFLPTLFQMAFNSTSQSDLYLTIGKDEMTVIKGTDVQNQELLHITNKDLSTDVIPEIYPTNSGIKIGFHNQIERAGNYQLQQNDSLVAVLSFNYPRSESNPVSYTQNELNQIIDSLQLTNFNIMSGSIDDFSEAYRNRETGIELWRWFVILALVFLAFEIILIRYFKPSVL